MTTPTEQLQYIADRFEEVLRKTAEIKKPATETGGMKASFSKEDITDVQSFNTHKDIRYSRVLSDKTKDNILNAYNIENLNDSIEIQRKVFSTLQNIGFFTNEEKTSSLSKH